MFSPIFVSLVESRPMVRYTLLASEARGNGHMALAAAMDARADSEAGA